MVSDREKESPRRGGEWNERDGGGYILSVSQIKKRRNGRVKEKGKGAGF